MTAPIDITDQHQKPAAPFAGAARAAHYKEDLTPPTTGQDADEVAPKSAREHLNFQPHEVLLPEAATSELPESATTVLDTGELDLELATLTGTTPPPATIGIRGLLARTGLKVAPSAAELAEREAAEVVRRDEEVIRQATWTRAVSILIANPKGGVGKTPTALLLGGTLAAIRGGSVAIMEVSDDPGALTFRAEGRPQLGIGELTHNISQIGSAGQLAGYTAPQTSFASVIGTVGRRPQLTGDDVTRVAAVLDSYYGIRVMDSGNQPSSSAFVGAADTTDVLLIPTLNAGDAVLEAIGLLDHLRATGRTRLADTAVLLRLTDGRPEHPQVMERIDRIIAGANVGQVHTIPYDPHIAERGQLTLGKLQPATRHAFTRAAAGVIRTLQTTHR